SLETTVDTTIVKEPAEATTLVGIENGKAPELTTCNNCGKPAQYLCMACGQIGPRYCSENCQTEDWTKGHSNVCKKTIESSSSPVVTEHEGNNIVVKRSNSLNRTFTRGNAAQIINAKKRKGSRQNNSLAVATSDIAGVTTADDQSITGSLPFDEDQIEEIKYYIEQVYRIIKPVVCCIVLSVLWVKISLETPEFRVQHGAEKVFNTPSDASETTLIFSGSIITVFFIPLDYITLSFLLWNFAVVGLISVFWKGPLLLQQIYLTIMSSLMAFSLTSLSEWATWILLGLLAIWVNAVWFMASPGLSNQINLTSSPSRTSLSTPKIKMKIGGEEIPLSENIRYNNNENPHLNSNDDGNNSQPSSISPPQPPPGQQINQVVVSDNEGTDDKDDEGLGDFVFYSVLVARAAMSDWITTITCSVAVLTGLNTTIFLLSIYKKALPALPISITFGMIFFFVGKFVLVPYLQNLGIQLIAV
ncbi:13881_t:CDS:10, partial [Entrophospora sp. SA101]